MGYQNCYVYLAVESQFMYCQLIKILLWREPNCARDI